MHIASLQSVQCLRKQVQSKYGLTRGRMADRDCCCLFQVHLAIVNTSYIAANQRADRFRSLTVCDGGSGTHDNRNRCAGAEAADALKLRVSRHLPCGLAL